MATTNKRQLRHQRIRKKVTGTAGRPRLAVYFSGQHIQAQIINDEESRTVASVHTTEEALRGDKSARANATTAARVGKLLAERGGEKNVRKVVFDRGGYQYHGKVKALADAAREGGLDF